MMTNLDYFKKPLEKYPNNLLSLEKDPENFSIKMDNLLKSKKLKKYLSLKDSLNTEYLKKKLLKLKISLNLCLNMTLKKEFPPENVLKTLGFGIEKIKKIKIYLENKSK